MAVQLVNLNSMKPSNSKSHLQKQNNLLLFILPDINMVRK